VGQKDTFAEEPLTRKAAGLPEKGPLFPLRATPELVPLSLFALIADARFETMLLALQVVVVAASPLNVTVLDPCVAPKFDPIISMLDPTPPPDWSPQPTALGR
jgi:hypothetical protein